MTHIARVSAEQLATIVREAKGHGVLVHAQESLAQDDLVVAIVGGPTLFVAKDGSEKGRAG